MVAKGECLRSVALMAVSAVVNLQQAAYAGPMSLDGQFQVNEGGAAVYTVPLQIAPGISGMEPKVALTYSSQGGNGPLGMGWSLSTQSAITRCSRTMAQDNIRSSVNYNTGDRFCLDGQRLMSVSGTYGEDGTIYRTERDGFSKVVSYGTSGTGPSYFKVWTKSGQIIEYGNTTASRVLPIAVSGITPSWVDGTIRYWAINKISDTKGNAYTYSYSLNGGEAYLAQISYTATAKYAAQNSVKFAYESRTDNSVSYHRGGTAQMTRRLKSIQMYEGDDPVREYLLTYTYGVATKRSRLASIKECSTSATVGPCLPPITFAWRDTSVEMAQPGYATPALPNMVDGYKNRNSNGLYMRVGDFNGDGRTDYMFIPAESDSRWLIAYGSETGLVAPDYAAPALPAAVGGYNTHHSEARAMQTGDFNGDGKTDYMYIPSDGDGRWLIAYGTATGLTRPNYAAPALPNLVDGYKNRNDNGLYMRTGDFNGDGKTDYMYIPDGSDGRWLIAYGSETGLVAPDYAAPALPAAVGGYNTHHSEARAMQTGDFNGDGKTDYMYIPSDGDGRWLIAYGAATGLTQPNYAAPALPNLVDGYKNRNDNGLYMRTGDFNGDGKTDYMYIPDGSDGRWLVAYSTGVGFKNPDYSAPALPATVGGYNTRHSEARAMQMGDFNGDGRTDHIYIPSNGDGRWLIAYGAATGFTQPAYADYAFANIVDGHSSRNDEDRYMQWGDFNGDGRTDYMYIPNSGDGRWLLSKQSSNSYPDLLNRVTTGQGAMITISYLPLTDSDVYTRQTTAVYPVIDVQAPMYVVNKVTTSNGVGGALNTSYKYFHLTAEAGTGRGLLGFRRVEATQVETQIRTQTYYSQSWPYVGMPTSTRKYLAGYGNADLLSQTIYSSECMHPGNGVACTVAYGKTYFPYISKSVESSWDLNGTALPVVTTETDYDKFGNATQVKVSSNDGYSKTTVNTYTNDTANWFLGRLIRSTVTSVKP